MVVVSGGYGEWWWLVMACVARWVWRVIVNNM